MAFGLGRLGWTPESFWGATPHELAAALTAFRPSAAEPMRRASLDRLMAAFPDLECGDDDERG